MLGQNIGEDGMQGDEPNIWEAFLSEGSAYSGRAVGEVGQLLFQHHGTNVTGIEV